MFSCSLLHLRNNWAIIRYVKKQNKIYKGSIRQNRRIIQVSNLDILTGDHSLH